MKYFVVGSALLHLALFVASHGIAPANQEDDVVKLAAALKPVGPSEGLNVPQVSGDNCFQGPAGIKTDGKELLKWRAVGIKLESGMIVVAFTKSNDDFNGDEYTDFVDGAKHLFKVGMRLSVELKPSVIISQDVQGDQKIKLAAKENEQTNKNKRNLIGAPTF